MFGFRWTASDWELTMDIKEPSGVWMLIGHQPSSWAVVVTWRWGKEVNEICDSLIKIDVFRLWSVETGTNLATISANSSVRCCNFSFSGNQVAYSTDKAMGHDCELFIIDTRTVDSSMKDAAPTLRLPMKQSKITSMLWFLDDTIITGHDNGNIGSYDLRVSSIWIA